MPADVDDWIQIAPVDWELVQREPFQRSFIASPGPEEDADVRREALGIRVEDAVNCRIPGPIAGFEDLGVLPNYALRALRENGIVAPTPIQAQSLPLVLAGHDVIGLAQTGSGKTLSFLLPAIVHMEAQPQVPRGACTPITLVIAPTRELAVQIAKEAGKVLYHSREGNHRGGFWAVCLYGGGNKREQMSNLSWGSQIVVATPGRLIDFMASGVVSMERVTYFVLDEADRMLDMGFQGDVASISGQVRPERQVLFFSATWSASVQALAAGLCGGGGHPVRIAVGQKGCGQVDSCGGAAPKARDTIIQEVIVVDYPDDWERQALEKKRLLDEYLMQVLSESDDHKILVFVSQKNLADELCSKLWDDGFTCGAMHGGKSQESRLWTLDQFRTGEIRLLVATDVLGRGIDIPSVSHVVVFDMGSVEDYVHRIGRTARGENTRGCALAFFEYYYKEPLIASEFIGVLEASGQPVPEGLRAIADEVASGDREVYNPAARWGSNRGKENRGAQQRGQGTQGSWERHLRNDGPSSVSCPSGGPPQDAAGQQQQPQQQQHHHQQHQQQQQQQQQQQHYQHEQQHQQQQRWQQRKAGGARPKADSQAVCTKSMEPTMPVATWLTDIDASGFLQEFGPKLEERSMDTLGGVLAEYVTGQEFAAERFFRDVGVTKFSHKGLFRKWFRELYACA